jgi:hypothetical protein
VLNKAPPAVTPRTPAARAAAGEQGMIGAAVRRRRRRRPAAPAPVPVLNNVPGVQALGLSFSPDKSKLALLLVDPAGPRRGRRVADQHRQAAAGKGAGGKGRGDAHGLQQQAPPARLARRGPRPLAGGRLVINADTGDTLAILDAGKIHAQAVTGDATIHLAHGDYASLEGLAVVHLNETRLPEKPGQPNRASAAPAK